MVTFETNDNNAIRFKISNNSATIQFDSKWKDIIRTALTIADMHDKWQVRNKLLMFNTQVREQR